MRKHVRLWPVLVVLTAVILATPGVHWRLIGLAKREAFYQGRPTSYWEREVKFRYTHCIGTSDYSTLDWTVSPSWWETKLVETGIKSTYDPSGRPPLLNGDEASVPVLEELLQSDDMFCFMFAFEGLVKCHRLSDDAVVVPVLLRACANPDQEVRSSAYWVLQLHYPDAAKRAGID